MSELLERPADQLPPYPLLRVDAPLLRRPPGDLQIGLDADAVVVESAPAGLARVLALLDGAHHLDEIHRRAEFAGVPPALLEVLLRRLAGAGLLVQGPRSRATDHRARPARSARVAIVGAGTTGRALAGLLADPGLLGPGAGWRIEELILVDSGAAEPTTVPDADPSRTADSTAAPSTNAAALGAILEKRSTRPGSPRITVCPAVPSDQPDRPALVVVCPDTFEADRVLVAELVRADLPHLTVRVGAATAVIGPLVLPGRSACVRCTDLARRDADPAWPGLLAQLSCLPTRQSAGSLGWAAGVAVAQILAFLSGGTPATVGSTIELASADFSSGHRVWRPHPDCGCRWLRIDLAQWNEVTASGSAPTPGAQPIAS